MTSALLTVQLARISAGIAGRILNLMPEAHQKIPLTGAWGCGDSPVRSDTLKQTGACDRIKGQGGAFGNFLSTHRAFHRKLSLKSRHSLLKEGLWQLLMDAQLWI